MLIFTGCSQKNPDVDMTGKDGKSTEVAKDMSADKKADNLTGMDALDGTSTDVAKDMATDADAIAATIAALESSINKIYFDFDKFNIRADMESKIKSNARLLNSMNARDFSIKIEGNSDEWGTDEYNYALALKRAKSVKNAIVSYGVDESRIILVSFGESNPAVNESNRAAWALNRRVEFKLLP
jgi:peptidoglycan-associated lipoprotein